MKRLIMILVLGICAIGQAATAPTNTLALYLVTDGLPWGSLTNAAVGPGVVLAAEPLLADSDFVSYDKTNHTFEITLEVAQRLALRLMQATEPGRVRPRSLTRWETTHFLFGGIGYAPFVLTAFGRPIYCGDWGAIGARESWMFPGVPSIMYHFPEIETGRIRLAITLVPMEAPSKGWTRPPDVRDDPRILEALRRLGL